MLCRRLLLSLVLISSLLAAGCLKEAAKRLGNLQALHSELTKKFGDDVHVNLNEGPQLVLTVTFINSALNAKSPQDRFKRAEETAQFIKTRYERIQNVTEIWVGFVRMNTRFVVFHRSEVLDYYAFDKDGGPLTPPDAAPGLATETGPIANYSSTSNQSDVSIGAIQLEGEPGKDGVTMMPHFNVPGDVNKKPSPPPKAVSFDFASYAAKARYDQTVPISFIADGKPVLQTEGTFVGSNAQFCYLAVPYPAFKRIIAGEELVVKLGDKTYPLPPSQFNALKEMGTYVK
jgi:hypothetical protein